MSDIPHELKYTKTHEWVSVEDDIATIGITDHAQKLLGDLVFVELPDDETTVSSGDEVAVVESVKAASDVYAPLSGEIVAINENLSDTPSLVNSDAFGDGWLFKVKIDDESELDALLSAEDYADLVAEEE